jgi:hypothetical protein
MFVTLFLILFLISQTSHLDKQSIPLIIYDKLNEPLKPIFETYLNSESAIESALIGMHSIIGGNICINYKNAYIKYNEAVIDYKKKVLNKIFPFLDDKNKTKNKCYSLQTSAIKTQNKVIKDIKALLNANLKQIKHYLPFIYWPVKLQEKYFEILMKIEQLEIELIEQLDIYDDIKYFNCNKYINDKEGVDSLSIYRKIVFLSIIYANEMNCLRKQKKYIFKVLNDNTNLSNLFLKTIPASIMALYSIEHQFKVTNKKVLLNNKKPMEDDVNMLIHLNDYTKNKVIRESLDSITNKFAFYMGKIVAGYGEIILKKEMKILQ